MNAYHGQELDLLVICPFIEEIYIYKHTCTVELIISILSTY